MEYKCYVIIHVNTLESEFKMAAKKTLTVPMLRTSIINTIWNNTFGAEKNVYNDIVNRCHVTIQFDTSFGD